MHEKISSEKSILTEAVINIVLTGNVFILEWAFSFRITKWAIEFI